MSKLRIDILSASELYQRTRTEPANRDLFKERELSASVKTARRLHYLSVSEYQHQVNVTLSLGTRIVGIAGLQVNPSEQDMLWVQHVSVEDKHRGKGYARMLIEAVYIYAVEQGKVVSPSSFSALGQRLKPLFRRLNEQYPQADAHEAFRDHLC